jgi:hypothetical protein
VLAAAVWEAMPSRVVVIALLAVAPAACGGHGAPARARVTAGHGDGISYFVPAGWHVARRRLTPHLVNPRELLTVGTGRLPAGGPCAQNPSAALAAMGAADVLVSVQERYGRADGFPPRPRPFSLPRATANEAQTCAGPRAPIGVRLLEFRDGGRGFHVFVAVGRAAPASRVRQALSVLDSLRVARRPLS